MNANLRNALGCLECCPYCGVKCTVSGTHIQHMSLKHRLMGFKGSFETNNGSKELLTEACDT